MDFNAVVEHHKHLREGLQAKSPIPFFPPNLKCAVGGNILAEVLCPKTDEQTVAGMLAMIPATGADEVALTFEGYSLPVEVSPTGPIAEEPLAVASLIILYVTKGGDVMTSINPYSIGDDGQLTWSSPGAVASPAVPKLVQAIETLLAMPLQDKEVSKQVCDWLYINGFALQIAPIVYGQQEG